MLLAFCESEMAASMSGPWSAMIDLRCDDVVMLHAGQLEENVFVVAEVEGSIDIRRAQVPLSSTSNASIARNVTQSSDRLGAIALPMHHHRGGPGSSSRPRGRPPLGGHARSP